MRFTIRKLTALAMTIGATLATAEAASAAPSFVVVADTRIGTFGVKSDGSLAGAIRAYGQPRLRRTGEACTATWAQYGLTMSFYNLGGANPCTPRFGRFSRAVMYGTRWRTDKGLRVGMSSKAIRRYYPSATFHRGLRFYWPSGWWLVRRAELFGGDGTYPGLLAATARGSVSSLHVRYPAGGD